MDKINPEQILKEFGDTTFEYCPHCGNEVEIASNKISNCPECMEKILPCSTCILNTDYDFCDWQENIGCTQYKH